MNSSNNTIEILSLDNFSYHYDPYVARIEYYFYNIAEDVIKEWNLKDFDADTCCDDSVGIIRVLQKPRMLSKNCRGRKEVSYMICADLSLKRIIKEDQVKTGRQIYTGDEEQGPLLDEWKTVYELSDTLYEIEHDEERMSTLEGIESIICNFINQIEEIEEREERESS